MAAKKKDLTPEQIAAQEQANKEGYDAREAEIKTVAEKSASIKSALRDVTASIKNERKKLEQNEKKANKAQTLAEKRKYQDMAADNKKNIRKYERIAEQTQKEIDKADKELRKCRDANRTLFQKIGDRIKDIKRGIDFAKSLPKKILWKVWTILPPYLVYKAVRNLVESRAMSVESAREAKVEAEANIEEKKAETRVPTEEEQNRADEIVASKEMTQEEKIVKLIDLCAETQKDIQVLLRDNDGRDSVLTLSYDEETRSEDAGKEGVVTIKDQDHTISTVHTSTRTDAKAQDGVLDIPVKHKKSTPSKIMERAGIKAEPPVRHVFLTEANKEELDLKGATLEPATKEQKITSRESLATQAKEAKTRAAIIEETHEQKTESKRKEKAPVLMVTVSLTRGRDITMFCLAENKDKVKRELQNTFRSADMVKRIAFADAPTVDVQKDSHVLVENRMSPHKDLGDAVREEIFISTGYTTMDLMPRNFNTTEQLKNAMVAELERKWQTLSYHPQEAVEAGKKIELIFKEAEKTAGGNEEALREAFTKALAASAPDIEKENLTVGEFFSNATLVAMMEQRENGLIIAERLANREFKRGDRAAEPQYVARRIKDCLDTEAYKRIKHPEPLHGFNMSAEAIFSSKDIIENIGHITIDKDKNLYALIPGTGVEGHVPIYHIDDAGHKAQWTYEDVTTPAFVSQVKKEIRQEIQKENQRNKEAEREAPSQEPETKEPINPEKQEPTHSEPEEKTAPESHSQNEELVFDENSQSLEEMEIASSVELDDEGFNTIEDDERSTDEYEAADNDSQKKTQDKDFGEEI